MGTATKKWGQLVKGLMKQSPRFVQAIATPTGKRRSLATLTHVAKQHGAFEKAHKRTHKQRPMVPPCCSFQTCSAHIHERLPACLCRVFTPMPIHNSIPRLHKNIAQRRRGGSTSTELSALGLFLRLPLKRSACLRKTPPALIAGKRARLSGTQGPTAKAERRHIDNNALEELYYSSTTIAKHAANEYGFLATLRLRL